MHSIVLLTALTATSGLFGGGHGKTKHCGRKAARGQCVSAPMTHCQPHASCGTALMTDYAPPVPMAPSPQMMAPAPPPMTAPPMAYTAYNSYYATPSTAPSCAGGSCARR